MALLFALFAVAFLLCSGQIHAATIKVNWSDVAFTSPTESTLQLVVNPQMRRGSLMHNGTFNALRMLGADHVRFVPWLPYPRLGVAELQPPNSALQCGTQINLQNLYMACPSGVFSEIEFASYGTPSGGCGAFAQGSCHATNSTDIVKRACLNKSSCLINANTPVFGDPCYGTVKYLSVQAKCTEATNATSWDFSLLDPMMEDLMEATQGHTTIINFSTIPQWMWNTDAPVQFPADPNQVFWSYEQGNQPRDNTMKEIAMYYQRLVSWYTKGGFYDEFGKYHSSGLHYNIPYWEVLNEVDSEHSMSPETYTRIYDAVVSAILEVQPNMKFVGMALAYRNVPFIEYFLNHSNHQPNIPIDYMSYHFYASSSSRTDRNGYLQFFPDADGFLTQVQQIQQVRAQLSPTTKTTIDEVGVILPGDPNGTGGDPDPLYWNAAGAMYVYLYAKVQPLGIEVLGESQLVGYPSQFPSVSMLNYTNGEPNARFWALQLVHDLLHPGDKGVTTSSDDPDVFAQAYNTVSGSHSILLVNKSLSKKQVQLVGAGSGTGYYVDGSTAGSHYAKVAFQNGVVTLDSWAIMVAVLA